MIFEKPSINKPKKEKKMVLIALAYKPNKKETNSIFTDIALQPSLMTDIISLPLIRNFTGLDGS